MEHYPYFFLSWLFKQQKPCEELAVFLQDYNETLLGLLGDSADIHLVTLTNIIWAASPAKMPGAIDLISDSEWSQEILSDMGPSPSQDNTTSTEFKNGVGQPTIVNIV